MVSSAGMETPQAYEDGTGREKYLEGRNEGSTGRRRRMMGVSQIMMALIWFGLIPVMLGMLYTKFSQQNRDSLMLNYCSGLIIMLGLCQLVTVPYVLNRGSFTFVSNLYTGIVIGLCIQIGRASCR